VFGFDNMQPVGFIGLYLIPQMFKLLKNPAKLKNKKVHFGGALLSVVIRDFWHICIFNHL